MLGIQIFEAVMGIHVLEAEPGVSLCLSVGISRMYGPAADVFFLDCQGGVCHVAAFDYPFLVSSP